MKTCLTLLNAALVLTGSLSAQVPNLVSYQGRISVGTTNFQGNGQFKFALVNTAGTTAYWRNAADTTPADGVPDAAVSLAVTKGLYSVLLGDIALTNMAAIPASVWTNADVRLRIWFNDGTTGFQLLTPDQRLAPNGYLPDGAVSNDKLANSTVTVTAGSGLSGGGTLALGGNVTLTNSGVRSLLGGGGIIVDNTTGAINLSSNATNLNTANTIVRRDGTGNFTAGTITGNLIGNASTATSATNFTGALAGNVIGTQSATVVATVGGVPAASVGSGANLALAATNANTANAIVRRDASGNFSAGIISGIFSGNGAALTNLNATNITSGTLNLPANSLIVGGTQLVLGSGNIGIGTASPSAGLHISTAGGDNTPQAWINQSNAADYSRVRMTVGGNYNGRWDIGVRDDAFVIYSGLYNKELLRLDDKGLKAVGGLIIENRTDDPPPETGRIWLRTDQ